MILSLLKARSSLSRLHVGGVFVPPTLVTCRATEQDEPVLPVDGVVLMSVDGVGPTFALDLSLVSLVRLVHFVGIGL